MTDTEIWTYEGYRNTVLGFAGAEQLADEFGIDTNRQGLDEWLGHAEVAAWQAGGHSVAEPLPQEWAGHHLRALNELSQA